MPFSIKMTCLSELLTFKKNSNSILNLYKGFNIMIYCYYENRAVSQDTLSKANLITLLEFEFKSFTKTMIWPVLLDLK